MLFSSRIALCPKGNHKFKFPIHAMQFLKCISYYFKKERVLKAAHVEPPLACFINATIL